MSVVFMGGKKLIKMCTCYTRRWK